MPNFETFIFSWNGVASVSVSCFKAPPTDNRKSASSDKGYEIYMVCSTRDIQQRDAGSDTQFVCTVSDGYINA